MEKFSSEFEASLRSLITDIFLENIQALREGTFVMNGYITKKSAAGYLDLSLNTISTLIKAKEIKKFKMGGRTLIRKSDLENLIHPA